jgi:DNA adenine methylase
MRYHGGKFKLRAWIAEELNRLPHECYVEPYCGAASVFVAKRRVPAEVLNDLDSEVVNLFRVLRDPESAHRLQIALELTPFAREEFEAAYAPSELPPNLGLAPAARAEFMTASALSLDPVERARRLVFRATAGLGTDAVHQRRGFRNTTQRGKDNRITVAQDWAGFPAQLPLFVERLRGVVIENRLALDVIREHDSPETLFYVDPPYLHETRSNDDRYNHEMTDADHEALAEVLHTVKGLVVLSGYASPLYEQLYAGWAQAAQPAFAHGAQPRTEVLYFSPNVQTRRLALF